MFGKTRYDGAYTTILKFIMQLIASIPIINGDGEYSRDFTYIDSVVEINMQCLDVNNKDAINQVWYGFGERTTLNELIV